MPNKDLRDNALGSTIAPIKSSNVVNAADFAVFQNIATMDTYLLTQGYTQAQLDIMTKNDKVYATRQKKAATSITP